MISSVTISGDSRNYFILKEKEKPAIQYIERWIMGDQEVCLQRQEDRLSYELLDRTTGKSIHGPIDLGDKSIEMAISYLIQCQPRISETGEIGFYPRSPPPYIQRWIIDDHEICLCREDDKLYYELLNSISGQTIKVPIDLGEYSIDFVIFALLKSQPEVKSGGVIVPEPPLISHFKWVFRNKEVQLLQKDSKNLKQKTGLIWQLFDTSTRTISQAPFSTGFSLQEWFKGEARIDDRNPPNYVSMKDMLGGDLGLASCFFQDHDIVKLEMQPTPYSLTHRLSAVYAKKIKKRSELDPSVFIDYDSWKITLINSGKSDKWNPTTWAGHAALIIEGKTICGKEGFFKCKAHLKKNKNGTAEVLLTEMSAKEEIFYSAKAKTRTVNRKRVIKMLKAIKREKEQQTEKDSQVLFSLSGNSSMFVKPVYIRRYSSIEDLVVNTLGPQCLDPSLALPISAPRKTITHLPFTFIEGQINRVESQLDAKSSSLLTSSNSTAKSLASSTFYKEITLIDRIGKKWTMKNNQCKKTDELQDAPSQLIFVQNQLNNQWAEFRLPDNCLTWARRKLIECGIDLQSHWLNSIYASPKEYMDKGLRSENDFSSLLEFCYEDRSSDEESHKEPDEVLSPLLYAIKQGNINNVESLLADERPIDSEALYLACRIGNIRIVKILLEKTIDSEDLLKALQVAIEHKKASIIEMLLKSGVRVDFVNSLYDTILHWLARRHSRSELNLEVVNLLMKYCNIDTKNKKGETPLILAVKKGKNQLIRIFLQNKALLYRARLDEKDNEDRTALWHACNLENKEMVSLLIEHGSDLIAAQKEGWFTNPFSLVRAKGFKDIEEIMDKALQEQEKAKKDSTCLVS